MDLTVHDTIIKTLVDQLNAIEDVRGSWKLDHTLAEIFLIILCSQLCGFESFREYEQYAKLKLNFLRRFLPYKNGSPSRSTFQRVLSIINPQKSPSCGNWMMANFIKF